MNVLGRRAPAAVPVGPELPAGQVALLDQRRRLAEQVAEATWDLGGLVYEMAVRDHFRVDVLSRRAADLQRLDAQLSEVERLIADGSGVGGACRSCGSPHGRSAEFCWSCGERLLVRQVLGTAVDAGPTAPDEQAPARPAAPAAGEGPAPRPTVAIDPDGDFEPDHDR